MYGHACMVRDFLHLLISHYFRIWIRQGLIEPIVFLPFMCRLRVLEIYVDPYSEAELRYFGILSFLIRSLRISLTSPATLEHLKFDIVFNDRFDCDASISTPLSLSRPVHGYKESTLTFYTPFWNMMICRVLTTLKSRDVSLMLCFCFARKAFCLSKPRLLSR